MKKKLSVKSKEERQGLYFREPSVEYFSTGCCLLDQVLGGGIAEGRLANVVGDRSSGKTLLSIECCLNFHIKYPDSKVFYVETEAAFDAGYAQTIGLNIEDAYFNFISDVVTVEELHDKIVEVLDLAEKEKIRCLIVLDSLDALSDSAELQRSLDQGSYKVSKAKLLSEIFRRVMKRVGQTHTTIIVISQVRERIGVMFGEKKMRSGGRALDFYASQILWLRELKKLKKTHKGMERTIGIQVEATCRKNKVGPGYRSCGFPILFHFGIDDIASSVEWLLDIGEEKRLELELTKRNYRSVLSNLQQHDYLGLREELNTLVPQLWNEIEANFVPTRKKYE